MKPTIHRLVLLLLLATCALGQSRDRRLVGLRFERADSNTGRVEVFAQLKLLTSDPSGVDMSFGIQLFRGEPGALGPQVGGTTSVPATTVDTLVCEQQNAYVDCSAGVCQMLVIDGVSTPGVCTSVEIDQVGGYSLFECMCIHETEVKIGDEIKVSPGSKFTAKIVVDPAGGAAPDTPGFPANDEITAVVGSLADTPTFAFGARMPTPMCGQGNSPEASLTQSLVPQGEGPYEYWGEPVTLVTLTHGGLSGNAASLIVAPPTLDAIPGLVGISVDIDPFGAGVWAVYDGLGLGIMPNWNPGAATVPQSITWTLPTALPHANDTVSMQGFVADPTAANGVRGTARNTIGLTTVPAVAPDLPPLAAPVPFPFPRDAIVPNHGPTASAPGASDGTLHSVVGRGFDPITPSSTTAAVNNIPVDVWLVRPREILFRLRPAHRSGIGGPLVVTSTGGVSPTVADQMEEWVFATPPVTEIKQETATSMGSLAGSFSNQPGLKAATGILPSGDQKNWYMEALPSGTQVRAFVGQLDGNGQLVVRCATTATGAVCFPSTAGQMWSQMISNPPGIEDLRIRHGNFMTSSFFASQDDTGPGSSPFAGMSGIPGSAALPGVPFSPFTMSGGADMVEISGLNVGGPGGHPYLLLVSWP